LVAFALALAGCTSGNDNSAREKPRRGGILRVGVIGPQGEPAIERLQSLDPAQARSFAELLAADQLFESLTSYDARTLKVRPGLAVSWKSTPDQQHWDFTLRPGAKFASGRPVHSLDVKYSLERIARKGSTSPVALQLEPVTGFRPFNVDGTAGDSTGFINYLFYDVTDKVKAGTRVEWWKADGVSYYTWTYGVNFKPTNCLTIRPEVRHMWAPGAREGIGGLSNNVSGVYRSNTVLGIDAVYTF